MKYGKRRQKCRCFSLKIHRLVCSQNSFQRAFSFIILTDHIAIDELHKGKLNMISAFITILLTMTVLIQTPLQPSAQIFHDFFQALKNHSIKVTKNQHICVLTLVILKHIINVYIKILHFNLVRMNQEELQCISKTDFFCG